MYAVALSHGGAQAAGHHAADVQHGHQAAPAEVSGRLALHAGEAPVGAAAWETVMTEKKMDDK